LITSYLEIPSRLQMMAAKARDVAKPQATDAVVGALEEVAHAA
jgi:UDP-N-acetylglucosamine:LPS N-acetylglucosamine transferase